MFILVSALFLVIQFLLLLFPLLLIQLEFDSSLLQHLAEFLLSLLLEMFLLTCQLLVLGELFKFSLNEAQSQLKSHFQCLVNIVHLVAGFLQFLLINFCQETENFVYFVIGRDWVNSQGLKVNSLEQCWYQIDQLLLEAFNVQQICVFEVKLRLFQSKEIEHKLHKSLERKVVLLVDLLESLPFNSNQIEVKLDLLLKNEKLLKLLKNIKVLLLEAIINDLS